MVIMQGADTWFWFWITLIVTIALTLLTWFYVTVGRDRPQHKQRRGEDTIERYGTLEEDRAPLPRFIHWTFIGVVVWAVAYIVWTGIEGIGI